MGRCRLKEDHEAIRALLARIERGEAEPSCLRDLLEPHLQFEEDRILPLLAERLPTGTGPVRTMLEDHATFRGLLDALDADPGGEAFPRLRTVLPAHFQKEEELILPFAHAHFCAEELGRIGCGPAAAETGSARGAKA